ncbi:MAG: sigma-54-dependent Fis family transcriptional regulator, partial [Ignavibacteria bacterium CG08_land_8_20_14_0_20_37_9]
IIGNSVKLFNVLRVASRVADTDASVLILGENGTGKDLIATAMHENSSRKNKPFIAVNCGAIPSDLLESELFGYESGAFTGAVKSKPGKLEMAQGGTFFLDEIAEMSINLQAKLLRVIQTKEIERLGGVSSRKMDIRFIAATNRDINELIEKNIFREDLYYRLKVIEIKLPALRERKEDIQLLIDHFLAKYSKAENKFIAQPEVYEILESYDWPGNIRELENVIHRSIILAKSNVITVTDLPPEIIENQKEVIKIQGQKTLLEAETEFRKMFILKTLRKTESKAEAAQILGINRTHLYKLLNQLGIE